MWVRKSFSVCPFKYVGKREKLSLTKFLNQLVEYVQLVLVISVWEKNILCNHTAWADVEWKMVIWIREDESIIKSLEKIPSYWCWSSSACSSSKEKGKQERVFTLQWEMRGTLEKFHTLRHKIVYQCCTVPGWGLKTPYPSCCHDILLCTHFHGQEFQMPWSGVFHNCSNLMWIIRGL